MTRHAVIDRKPLADKLVDVIDKIRRRVHGKLGTRTYRVQIVTRTWSEGEVGLGTPVVRILELDPRPLVKRSEGDRLAPGGREATGDIMITQISLRYSVEEIQPVITPGMEVGWRVIDTGGQGQPDQWYVASADPITRRGDNSGDNSDWSVKLKQSSPMSDFDGGD